MIYDENNDSEISGSSLDDLLGQLDGKANSYENEEEHKQEVLRETEKRSGRSAGVKDLEAVYDVPVQISAVLGRSTMPVHQLLKLGRGAVVELDRRVGEAIDIYVNNRLIARGEVVVVDDHLGVTMTEIIKSDRS
ncbi:MAG: flagellar motor switch protein FliN [Alphaproteobacteria bacterium]|nr:flagellar motor switch protein FliN [Alphaproteobacteria bacterium]MDP5012221.1 flagellar motor switch protein FliN [Alphaproteobacteria bacterium]